MVAEGPFSGVSLELKVVGLGWVELIYFDESSEQYRIELCCSATFKNINGRVLNSPDSWRIRYGCGIENEESAQHRNIADGYLT